MDRPSGVIDPDGAKCVLLRISTRVLLELLGIRLDIVRKDRIERAVAAKLHQPSKAIRSVVTLSGQAYGEGRGEYVDIGLY